MEIAIAVVFIVFAVLAFLLPRRQLDTMRDYREQFRREFGDGWAQISEVDRTSAKREIRRGKAVSDPNVADVLIREYDALDMPPDFSRRAGIVGLAGSAIICVLAAISGLRFIAIAAGFAFCVFLAMNVWKWRLRSSMARSVVATRRMHHSE
jgi:hypothetical protein